MSRGPVSILKSLPQPLLKGSAVLVAAICTLVFAPVRPASAGEYCRADVTSKVVSCSFATLEQCQWTSAGRGGDCFRDPWLPAAGTSAFAQQRLSSGPRGRGVN
jgi:hypothetical protein